MPPTKKAAPAKKTAAKTSAAKKTATAARAGTNRFVVDLGSVQVPDDVAREIEAQIRKATLEALAGIDLKGDLQMSSDLRNLGATRGIRIALAKTQLTALK
jgi:hypothetical protein